MRGTNEGSASHTRSPSQIETNTVDTNGTTPRGVFSQGGIAYVEKLMSLFQLGPWKVSSISQRSLTHGCQSTESHCSYQ